MGGTLSDRTCAAMAASLCAAILCAASIAGAQTRRVVVDKFEGPSAAGKLMRKAVLEIVGDVYEVLPYRKYRVAGRRLGIEPDSIKSCAAIARHVGADAIVQGEIKKNRLTVRVREGRSGRVIDKFAVQVSSRGASDHTREVLTDELVDLIDSTEPVNAGRSAIDGGEAEASTVATRATLLPTATTGSWVDDKLDEDDTGKKPSKPSAISLQVAVGVAGSARQLQFAFKGSLSEEQRPQEFTGSPSPGIAVLGVADVDALGISTEFRWQRSIGARIAFQDGAMTRQTEVAMSQLGVRAVVRRNLHRRLALQAGAGYQTSSYTMRNRPNGLLIPDARYAFLEIGGGGRVKLRDNRLVATLEASYLYKVSTGGITDPKFYGSAIVRGFRSELGLEIEATETTYVRVSGSYALVALYFNGDGELSTDLDDNADRDVNGAHDKAFGGSAMVGFRF